MSALIAASSQTDSPAYRDSAMSGARPDSPIFSSLDQAAAFIVSRLASIETVRPVIGVTGPVGSGKSTLAALIAKAVGGFVLSTDRYLPDYADVPAHLRDEPEQSDLDRLASDLAGLRRNGLARLPEWSFHEHRRTGEEHVRVAGPVVCEGLMALHERVLEQLDLRIFVEASATTRWDRWEAIERSGERGWGVEAARRHFDAVAEPTFHRFAEGYRAAADVVVENDSHTQDRSR